jgi:hypothetical protein
MFAGPNGSGKSTIKTVLPPELLGIYINPDEIEKEFRNQGFINLIPSEFKQTLKRLPDSSTLLLSYKSTN